MKIALSLIGFLLLGSVLGFTPQDIRVVQGFTQFQQAYDQDEYGEMALHLAETAQYLTWRPELWDKAGQFARLAGEDERAQQYFERAKSLDVLSQQGNLSLGEIYRGQGEEVMAIEMWSQIPDSPAAAQKKAQLHYERGEYLDAIHSWEDYLSLVSEVDTEAHFKLGLLLAAVDPLQALTHLERAAPDYPQATKLRNVLASLEDEEPAYWLVVAGQSLGSLDRWKLASHAFEEALELRPDYPQAWAYWGEALQHVQDEDHDPLRALEHAYELDPGSPLINIILGTYWKRQGEHQQALTYFKAASELWPDNPDVYVELGRTAAVLGDLKKALSRFKEAIQVRPDSPEYYRLLAQFCVDFHYKVKEEGLPAARKAVVLSNESPSALVVMGQILFELEDLQNAKKFYLQALNKEPTYPPAHFHLGMTYLTLEEESLAESHLRDVLRFSTSVALREQTQSILSTFSP